VRIVSSARAERPCTRTSAAIASARGAGVPAAASSVRRLRRTAYAVSATKARSRGRGFGACENRPIPPGPPRDRNATARRAALRRDPAARPMASRRRDDASGLTAQ
jgi:hypothetical protein